jgi:hypothetical protein
MSRTFNLQDLQSHSLPELHVLRGHLQKQLNLTAPHSDGAKEILLNISIIDLAIRRRAPAGPRL